MSSNISKIGKTVETLLDEASVASVVDVPITTKTSADRVLKYLSDNGRNDFNVLARGYDSNIYALQLQKVEVSQNA